MLIPVWDCHNFCNAGERVWTVLAAQTPSIFCKTAYHTPTLVAAVNAHAPGVELMARRRCTRCRCRRHRHVVNFLVSTSLGLRGLIHSGCRRLPLPFRCYGQATLPHWLTPSSRSWQVLFTFTVYDNLMFYNNHTDTERTDVMCMFRIITTDTL